ncbi:nucleotidyltransferase domain-containing protein [Vulcanisaeta distributa]|uniref:DNA polymerase beta domain protein region n=1 Tax=Vulcanisaeta distributa (strain DSM 14429 / JCM 11212 / NBRC 100878 / IC-017) TaxID=572478 RepID=E1QQZ2_VULDI|nr:nucleotidyltransferase domain-containing protein [Vulcanisaeta distributa]ADN50562.1 DNA polymerase beta domain protein region [Vulcanisaeta distributa DSM 14429]
MNYDYLIEDARRRQDVFRNLDKYLRIIKEVVKSIDPNAEVYLFGSVAENRYALSSDIDVLVVTNVNPGIILERLWKAGIGPPFEIHVRTHDKLAYYERFSKLIRV